MSTVNRRYRRGSVPVEYVFLTSLLGGGLVLGVAFPGMFANLMVQGAQNMELGREGEVAYAGEDWAGGEEGPIVPSYVPEDDDWTPSDPEGSYQNEDDFEDPTSGEEASPWDDHGPGKGNGNGSNNPNKGCNQGLGNGAEGCDPGNSNHNQPSNDEPGGGRGKGNGKKYSFSK